MMVGQFEKEGFFLKFEFNHVNEKKNDETMVIVPSLYQISLLPRKGIE
jgi:hypothetical protein